MDILKTFEGYLLGAREESGFNSKSVKKILSLSSSSDTLICVGPVLSVWRHWTRSTGQRESFQDVELNRLLSGDIIRVINTKAERTSCLILDGALLPGQEANSACVCVLSRLQGIDEYNKTTYSLWLHVIDIHSLDMGAAAAGVRLGRRLQVAREVDGTEDAATFTKISKETESNSRFYLSWLESAGEEPTIPFAESARSAGGEHDRPRQSTLRAALVDIADLPALADASEVDSRVVEVNSGTYVDPVDTKLPLSSIFDVALLEAPAVGLGILLKGA